jgi:putative CocE/NonD family hydrolase
MGNAGVRVTADYIESARYRPQVSVDEALWGRRLSWYRDWVTSTQRSDPYWREGFWALLAEIPSRVKVPVYIGEGWYDHHLGSALKTWEALSQEAKQQSALRIGAWNHGFAPCVEGIEAKNLENSDLATAYEWFDAILRGGKPPHTGVSYYRIGADRWERAPGYPLASTGTVDCYLSGGALAKNPLETGGARGYTYDPDDPVMIHGAESLFRSMKSVGSLRQPECDDSADVLSFVSEPLEENLDILGKIAVELYVSSDAEDTAFTVRVMEVRGDGTYNVRGSIATLAFRNGDRREGYTPGDVVKLTIDMWDIAWRFQSGSRLRLDISSSGFPEYSVHTNRSGVWSEQESAVKAEQRVYFGGRYPSKVSLPL